MVNIAHSYLAKFANSSLAVTTISCGTPPMASKPFCEEKTTHLENSTDSSGIRESEIVRAAIRQHSYLLSPHL